MQGDRSFAQAEPTSPLDGFATSRVAPRRVHPAVGTSVHPEPGLVPLDQPVERRGVERADRIAAPPRRHRERARRVWWVTTTARCPARVRLLELALDEPQVRHMPLDAPGRGEVLSVRPAMGGSTTSFLLDWNPGIGDRERGAQPLVEFSRRLSAVPSAPGERACFVFGAGRDHQAQSGLGCSTVPVLSLWRVRRHGDLPCGCPSGTPALRRSPPCVSWTVPFGALRRFASHPHRGARGRPVRFGCIVVSFLVLVIVVTVRSIVVLYREVLPRLRCAGGRSEGCTARC